MLRSGSRGEICRFHHSWKQNLLLSFNSAQKLVSDGGHRHAEQLQSSFGFEQPIKDEKNDEIFVLRPSGVGKFMSDSLLVDSLKQEAKSSP